MKKYISTIVFFIGSASSHYKATFQLGKQLFVNGHRIIYAGEADYKVLVEQQGFEFCKFPTILKPKPINMRQFLHSLKNVFSKNAFKNNYDSFLNEVSILGKVLEQTKPDMALFDAHLSLYAILFPEYRSGIVQTMISTDRGSFIPPLNCSLIPNQESFLDRLRVSYYWKKNFFKRNLGIYLSRIMYFGQDNFSLFIKRFKEKGLDVKKRLNFDRTFHLGINGIPEFILTPKEFDFPWKVKLKNQYFVGPSVDMSRKDISIDKRYTKIMENIMQVKKMSNVAIPLVYCSLGTMAVMSTKYFDRFMDKMIHAFQDRQNYQLIISLGYEVPEEQLPQGLPSNIHFLSFVPQLDVLSKCDAMISAPGINSIKECILYKVPMILYAYGKWDHRGNVARAEYHGLGLRGDLKRDSSDDIFRKLEKVIKEESFQKNINKMSEAFHRAHNSGEELSVFNVLIGEENLPLVDLTCGHMV